MATRASDEVLPIQPEPASARAFPFTFEGQTSDGARLDGTIEAIDADSAVRALSKMGLRILRLRPSASAVAPAARGSARPVRGDDFLAFNEQLTYLARAGMPLESGLRLIARDLRGGALAKTVRLIADELDQGVPLGEAFDRHRDRFPPLYGRLVEAGARSGDLAGVLLSFGAHLEMQRRLRHVLWRTFAYPLMVLAGLALVLMFLGAYVLPQFREIYIGAGGIYTSAAFGSHVVLPASTRILLDSSRAIPWVVGVVLAAILLGPIAWQSARRLGKGRGPRDSLALRLPLVGAPLRLSLIARWCDALRIGVVAGLPLTDAIALAGDAAGSLRLKRDGEALSAALQRGSAHEAGALAFSLLPATVPASIELASARQDLPAALDSLARLYERQADARINAIPAVLTPILIMLLAVTIGFVIMALLEPMLRFMDILQNMFR